MKKFEVVILGSGTSMGVPMVGCGCRVCCSQNIKDKRLRASVLIKIGSCQFLIDTSIDYRRQMLNEGIKHLNAIIYTHHHVDHILGMDDLRSLNILNKSPIHLYGMEETFYHIKRVFKYAFTGKQTDTSIPCLTIHLIKNQPFFIDDIKITPIPLLHGKLPVLGFRIGDFAYCTDVSKIPETSYKLLKNVKILILDALRHKPHPTHFSVEEAIVEAQKIGAQKTYFTHMSHGILHNETEAQLPKGIFLAYDGLKFNLVY